MILDWVVKVLNKNDILKDNILVCRVKQDYLNGVSPKIIADYLGMNKNSVGHLLRALPLTEAEIGLRKVNILRNKIKFNRDKLLEESPEKNYILGFVTGDGNIECREGRRKAVRIYSSDEQIIRDIVNYTEYKGTVSVRKYQKGKEGYEISLYDDEVTEHLIRKGLVPNKSVVGGKVSYDCRFERDFLRGLLDSDGSVTMSNGGSSLRVYFFGHKNVISQVRDILNRLEIRFKDVKRRDNIDGVALYTQSEVKKLHEFLYYDGCLCLTRKKSLW